MVESHGSSLAWYSVQIAEIRESTSNNRIRTTGLVPGAMVVGGNADGSVAAYSGLPLQANKTAHMSPLLTPNQPQVIVTPEPRSLSLSVQQYSGTWKHLRPQVSGMTVRNGGMRKRTH
ncbi:uncharacterized protein EI90DRAFT_135085 [Cantharellus anzutake]|uniref:uncharacterized protein n=1 Tax=Cantharellus anzutake TaxID=1750568 RepID=UPI0019083945|nr:uncharacterized protein EI90DRAFT_135085 [Cantharellus anzutake]KAF8318060.1 hypothetical protein EI90DRAFT_135085 [Cantharellus anzutake]